MKIDVLPYDPSWPKAFALVQQEIAQTLEGFKPVIEHIGSTSIEGLYAKPIIDILVGLKDEGELDQIIAPMLAQGYVYYEKFNSGMPYRRFFIKLTIEPGSLAIPPIIREGDTIPKDLEEHTYRLAHIHILPYGSEHWTRHVAFRDYIKAHPDVKAAYQQLKQALSLQEWADGNAYNDAKDAFIKTEEANAVAWYAAR